MIDLIIKAYKPNLKASSLKIYMTSLRKLNDGNDIKNIDFLKDYDNIILKLEPKKNNTKKNYLNAIIIVLKALHENDKLIEKYEELRDGYQKEYNDVMASNSKTPAQQLNWISWQQFNSMITSVFDTVKLFEKKNVWSVEEMLEYQVYVILNLYRVFPLRNDFHDMKVISQREYNKNKESKDNFIIVTKGKYKLILNDFKTSAKYKQIKLDIEDKKLQSIITRFLKHNKSGYLLVNPHNPEEPINSNSLTKLLINTSLKYTGKRVSTTLIRHIWLTEKIGSQIAKQQEIADVMGHSLEMQKAYVKLD